MSVREAPHAAEQERGLRDEIEALDVQLRQVRQALEAQRAAPTGAAEIATLDAQLLTQRAVLAALTEQCETARQGLLARKQEFSDLQEQLSALRTRLAPMMPRGRTSTSWGMIAAIVFAVDGLAFFVGISQQWGGVIAVSFVIGVFILSLSSLFMSERTRW